MGKLYHKSLSNQGLGALSADSKTKILERSPLLSVLNSDLHGILTPKLASISPSISSYFLFALFRNALDKFLNSSASRLAFLDFFNKDSERSSNALIRLFNSLMYLSVASCARSPSLRRAICKPFNAMSLPVLFSSIRIMIKDVA